MSLLWLGYGPRLAGPMDTDKRLNLGVRLQVIHYEFRRYAQMICACEDGDPGLADRPERDSSELRHHSLCD